MPPVKVTRSQSTGVPTSDVTPEEAAAIRSSVGGKEQAPTQQQQAGFVNWRRIADQLGDPFSVEQIPISKLRMMRRDPTIGFGLSFIKTPHIRARWYIDAKDSNGPNAQIAAHLDHDLRRIMASIVLQWCNSLDFGFQAIAKRFEAGIPAGTFVDQNPDGSVAEKPIWQQGNIQPIRWKPFVALPPESVEPIWANDGSFNGIDYDATQHGGAAPGGTNAQQGAEENKYQMDLYHSLWITNERDQNFGCQPPDELVLTTNRGYVPIGELDPDIDLLVSYSKSTAQQRDTEKMGWGSRRILRGSSGYANGANGFRFSKDTRPYSGELIIIETKDGKKIKITPNHKFTVKWSREAEKYWAVYLMRRGDWWRIGITRLHRDKGHASSGVGMRLQGERADAAWILDIFESKREAIFHESLWSNVYNIPDLTFESNEDNISRLDNDDLHEIWDSLESYRGARELLHEFNLYEDFPFYVRNRGQKNRVTQSGWHTQWTCFAANLMPGLMFIPTDPGEGFDPIWQEFDIKRDHYEGDVVSLDVEPWHHYVSNGVITQNSIFGYPRLGYCNPPEAPILMGDYSLKQIGDIEIGDEIIGWEQKQGRQASGLFTPRSSLTRSKVTDIGRRNSEIVKVTFDSGRVIRCTPDHLWLHHHKNRATPVENNPWTIAKAGRVLSRVIEVEQIDEKPIFYEQLSEEQKTAANWLGGIYDGEGSGSYIAQDVYSNSDVYERIGESLEFLEFEYTCNEGSIWIKGGREELMRFARLARPTRLQALDREILGHRFQRPEKIISVEPDGEGEVVSLTTTTGNYICWGLASKNCYRYWWSYWFRWAIADRAFEKKADPSILIYHPEGEFLDEATGQKRAYSDYALELGNRLRSGGVLTLPSTPIEGANGPTNIREWEIDFTKDMVNFDPFDKSFDYLDIGKIRSLWIPEQSLVEGKGGTSSRNVAAQLDSSFTESQAVMSVQLAETINRWIIPQWLAVNYPEFIQNNGTANIVIQGFADEDVAFTQQILQLIGQQVQGINKLLTMVDLNKILDDAGVPLLDVKEQKLREQQLVQQQQQDSSPASVEPKPGAGGTVGVVPTPTPGATPSGGNGNVGGPNGTPSTTGFSHQYIQPREVIYLTENSENPPRIRVKRVPDSDDGVIARFDSDENTVYLSESATDDEANKYLAAIGESLVEES